MEPGSPECHIVPLPEIGGERRTYTGLLQPFAAHAHDHGVVGLVHEGVRRLNCNERTLNVAPGDVIVFNPGDVHACTQAGKDTFAYDSITFPASALSGRALAGPVVRNARARRVFEALIRSIDEGAALESTLFALFDAIGIRKPAVQIGARGIVAGRVREHLQANMQQPPSMEGLCAGSGLSKHALIRAYKKRYAITPMRHVSSFRVQRACALLRAGETPAEVAAIVGFADQAHFTRTFKQQLGTTPAAYQRMVAEGCM